MRVCVCVRACLSVFSSVTLRIDHALPRGPLLVVGGGGSQWLPSGCRQGRASRGLLIFTRAMLYASTYAAYSMCERVMV